MEGESRQLNADEAAGGYEDCVIISGNCSDQSSDAKNVPLTQVMEAICTVEHEGRRAVRSWGGITFGFNR